MHQSFEPSVPMEPGDSGDIAGLKGRDLTTDESRQRRRCVGVLISAQSDQSIRCPHEESLDP